MAEIFLHLETYPSEDNIAMSKTHRSKHRLIFDSLYFFPLTVVITPSGTITGNGFDHDAPAPSFFSSPGLTIPPLHSSLYFSQLTEPIVFVRSTFALKLVNFEHFSDTFFRSSASGKAFSRACERGFDTYARDVVSRVDTSLDGASTSSNNRLALNIV